MCIHKSDVLSWEKAAGIPETWITAIQALWTVGGFKKGDRVSAPAQPQSDEVLTKQVLMHAGASAVGIAAVQLAQAHGAAAVYTTTSDQKKINFCTETLGATAGFNYKTQDFAEEIMMATDGKGVDLIIDPVGQAHLQKDIDCAARDGRIVVLAIMSGAIAKEINIAPILSKRLRIEGTTLRSRDVEYQRALRDKLVEEALPGLTDGSFKIFIEKVFSWKDVSTSHYYYSHRCPVRGR